MMKTIMTPAYRNFRAFWHAVHFASNDPFRDTKQALAKFPDIDVGETLQSFRTRGIHSDGDILRQLCPPCTLEEVGWYEKGRGPLTEEQHDRWERAWRRWDALRIES